MLAAARVKERNRAGMVFNADRDREKTEAIGHWVIATFNFSF
jgi:hypothetical protein